MDKGKRSRMRSVSSIGLILAFALCGMGQAQMSSGDINGTVRDPDGALVPGVAVSIVNPDTGLGRDTQTGDEGVYRFFLLSPGSYEIRFELSGFAIQTRRPIQVQVGQSLSVDVQLTPAALEQEIVVVGDAPLIESGRTQQADTVTELRIDNLPINGRDFLDFSLLTPGVTDSKALIGFRCRRRPVPGFRLQARTAVPTA